MLILKGRQLYGSILYTCSFLFKQISLYYSVGFFFYLLSWALEPSLSSTSVKFTRISLLILNVVSTVGVSLLPWALASHSVTEFFQHLAQIVHRLFPFARGIFEDKVSNFWCISSLLIKWKRFFSLSKLIRLSTFATILGSFPSGILFLLRSRMQRRNDFLILLSISSLAFFLFSFQVHEKSILFPSLPISLLVLEAPYLVTWFQSIALFSMFPLFFKDGLSFPYFTSQFLLLFLGYKLNSRSAAFGKYYSIFLSGIMFSYLGWVTLHAIHYQFPLPGDLSPRYPDLVNYGIATFSFFHFLGAWILLQLALFCSPKAKQQ